MRLIAEHRNIVRSRDGSGPFGELYARCLRSPDGRGSRRTAPATGERRPGQRRRESPGYAVHLSAGSQPIDDLGSYERPPVTELVLGVQFSAPVIDLDVLASFGLRVKDGLPRREYHPPLLRAEESFGGRPKTPPLQLQVVSEF